MRTVAILTCLLVASLTSTAVEGDGWSQAVDGLQARLTLEDKGTLHGARWLVPYLELRNVRNLINQLEVNCDRKHLKVELLDADGKPVRIRSSVRSGPAAELNTVILPWDSSIRISLENRNWGIPRGAVAMVSTDSGAWVVGEPERGKVFLRATLTGEKTEPAYKGWAGTIQTPPLKVDWK